VGGRQATTHRRGSRVTRYRENIADHEYTQSDLRATHSDHHVWARGWALGPQRCVADRLGRRDCSLLDGTIALPRAIVRVRYISGPK